MLEKFDGKTGLKKVFVCRNPTDSTVEVPTQNILLNFRGKFIVIFRRIYCNEE